MFDSGGLGLKPNDLVHATMKGDMSGAGAVLAAMTTLKALGCPATVTGYLMCTDNMPSGTAMKLGDVLTVRGGKTVEVINTDAEGRLVMADGLVLSTEQNPQPDAIVDIATLTGACQRALGVSVRRRDGQPLRPSIEQVLVARPTGPTSRCGSCRSSRSTARSSTRSSPTSRTSAATTPARSRRRCSSRSSWTGMPWAHIDIAGTARVESDDDVAAEGRRPASARGCSSTS